MNARPVFLSDRILYIKLYITSIADTCNWIWKGGGGGGEGGGGGGGGSNFWT